MYTMSALYNSSGPRSVLRDDTDKNQWFTDGYHWEICPDEVAYINAWINKYESSPHKATVEELIEHFKFV